MTEVRAPPPLIVLRVSYVIFSDQAVQMYPSLKQSPFRLNIPGIQCGQHINWMGSNGYRVLLTATYPSHWLAQGTSKMVRVRSPFS